MLVFLFGFLFFLCIIIFCGVILGYKLPILRSKRACIWVIVLFLILYGSVALFEIQLGLMLPFMATIAVFINLSRSLSERFAALERVRAIFISLAFIIPIVILFYMGLNGGKYAYPEDEREREMVKEAYSNLSSRHPLQKLLATHYHYKIYYVKDHCPIAKTGKNPNHDYVIATYKKSFGLVVGKMYHDCGFGQLWHSRPKKSWELSKNKLVSKG